MLYRDFTHFISKCRVKSCGSTGGRKAHYIEVRMTVSLAPERESSSLGHVSQTSAEKKFVLEQIEQGPTGCTHLIGIRSGVLALPKGLDKKVLIREIDDGLRSAYRIKLRTLNSLSATYRLKDKHKTGPGKVNYCFTKSRFDFDEHGQLIDS